MIGLIRQHRRWIVVILLFFLSLVNYLDRQTLSVLAPTLRAKLHFGAVEYSYVVSCFLAAYAVGYAAFGPLLDHFGVRRVLSLAVVFWSISAALHSAARQWQHLALCRFLLGLGESLNVPGGARAIREWIPKRERGLSMAIFSNGFLWGSILAPPLVSAITLRCGWQAAFLVTAALGFVWLIFWRLRYRAPEHDHALTAAERALVLEENTAAPKSAPWSAVLLHPFCGALFAARFLTDPLPYFFQFWLPEYLESSRGFTLAMVGLLGWIPFLAADVGGPLGGFLSDHLVRKGAVQIESRLRIMFFSACAMPLAAVAVRAPSAVAALVLIAVILAAHSAWNANLLTLTSEVFPVAQTGTLLALASMGGSLGGIVSTLVAGQVIARAGYVPVFTALALPHLVGYAILSRIRSHHEKLAL
jgi:ACS family hexuronate transporter-like MFS transporter